MKVLLARMVGDTSDEWVLKAALIVARRFDAHVEALHVGLQPADLVPFLGESVPSGLIEQLYKKAEIELSAAKARAHERFQLWCETNGIARLTGVRQDGPSAAWNEQTGNDHEVIARAGRTADLIVLARPASKDDLRARLAAEGALFGSGRPALIVPAEAVMDLSAGAVIAWNGSREAARALGAALPFLSSAKTIEILSVGDGENRGVDAGSAQSYLAWHNIKAKVTHCEPEGSVADTLLARARVASGLLVLGAYSHTRFREMIFGGVTEQVLTSSDVPLLMCH